MKKAVRNVARAGNTSPPLHETDVSFPSIDGSVTLAGTFAWPAGDAPAPAVVLVSGTGPLGRDVTFAGHALFRVLARSLARNGVASLRFDKRGVGESEGDFLSARPEDFVADVLGARDFLVTRREVPAERVGLVGHSEGGEIALRAAAAEPATAFCAALATPLLDGVDNFVHAFALLARGGLQRDGEFDRTVTELATLLAIARSSAPGERELYAQELAAGLAPRIVNERTQLMFGTSRLSGPEFLSVLSSGCLDTCLGWNPERIVSDLACPVLVIYGAKDLQAPALENLAAARALVERLAKRDWTIREVPEMNHAFQRCRTGMPDEYASIDHVMAEEVVEEVAKWINERMRGQRA